MHSLSHSGVCQKRIIVTLSLSFYNNVFYTTMVMYTFHYRVDRIKGTPSHDTFQLFAAYSLVADYTTRGLHLPQCTVDLILFMYALI